MTNEEYLRTAPTAELARYITACGYCAYLTDGCQRGQGCIEGHRLWLARDRDGKLTNRERLFAMNNKELAEFILHPLMTRSLWSSCADCSRKMQCTGENPCPEALINWLEMEEEA